MRLKGFIGPTYALASQNIEAQRTVNCYPEIDELHTAADGEIGSLVSTPGSRLLATLGTGPIRGMYVTSDAKTFIAVSGNQVFSVKKDWTSTLVGVIGSTTGSVGIADNGKQICIVDGKGGYIITLETMATKAPNAVILITSDGFSGATNVVFQDGYFIFNKPNIELKSAIGRIEAPLQEGHGRVRRAQPSRPARVTSHSHTTKLAVPHLTALRGLSDRGQAATPYLPPPLFGSAFVFSSLPFDVRRSTLNVRRSHFTSLPFDVRR